MYREGMREEKKTQNFLVLFMLPKLYYCLGNKSLKMKLKKMHNL